MIQCRLIDAHGVSLWFGLPAHSLPSEIRRPTGRMIPPSEEDAQLCRAMGIVADDCEEFRLFRLHSANRQTGVVEFREVK